MRWLLLVAVALLTSRAILAERIRRFDFTITSSLLDPDCNGTAYSVPTINGQFPGPTIRVRENDEVEVIVRNEGDQPSSLHFHGIRQYGTVESDGVPDVTQNAIPPGGSFTHRFKLMGQSGTYFYHAHVGTQDDTVQGAFIIDGLSEEVKDDKEEEGEEEGEEEEGAMMVAKYYENHPTYLDTPPYLHHDGPYSYHGEFTLHLTEWWHQPFHDRESFILSPDFTHDTDAETLLINGRSMYDPAAASCSSGGHTTIDVLPNRVYRMRVIGGVTFRTFGLGIANHEMTIIEVDGALVQPYRTSSLEVGPGQRYSVLIHTTVSEGNADFIIATNRLYRNNNEGDYSNGVAYLRYLDPSRLLNKRSQDTVSASQQYAGYPVLPKHNPPNWIWPFLRPLKPAPSSIMNNPPDRTLKIRPSPTNLPDGSQRYTINGNLSPMIMDIADAAKAMSAGVSEEDTPLLYQYTLAQTQTMQPLRLPLQPDGFEPLLRTYPIQYGEVIDLVIQNVKTGPLCIHHPWHTHGHSHYPIASGQGEYVHARDHIKRNFPHPIYKDVTPVYATPVDPQTNGCGWTKIRIVADNPGVWAVHCHITAHMLQGMLFVLEEASDRIQEHQLYR